MKAWISVSAAALIAACGTTEPEAREVALSSNAVRPITNQEARADFAEITDLLRSYWGAQERKQQRYGFSFDELASDYEDKVAAASSETEYRGLFARFLAQLKDAHISLSSPVEADELSQLRLPLLVTPIEDRFVVYAVAADGDFPFQRGDELLSIDGVPAAELAEKFSIYDGVPNPITAKHISAARLTSRQSYMSPDLQDGDSAVLQLRKPNGDELEVTLAWSALPHQLPPTEVPDYHAPGHAPAAISRIAQEVASAELLSEGESRPFFLTPQVVEKYAVELVQVSKAALDQFNVNREVADSGKYLAFRYTYGGKTVLLLRIPDYVPYDLLQASESADVRESINYLRALLVDQAPLVDGLIVDETHNPGGDISFVDQFVSLLSDQPVNVTVQKMNADRAWIGAYLEAAQALQQSDRDEDLQRASELEGFAHQIDLAYSGGEPLSEPLPYPPDPAFPQLDELPTVIASDSAHWTKPFIMLTDELSASGGDATPLIVQANHLGLLFGQTTMGAGGNVEGGTLAYTGLSFNFSCGLFTVYDPSGKYPESRFVEDDGVTPDITYSHTLKDFRAGYIDYVASFSEALLEQLKPHHPHH